MPLTITPLLWARGLIRRVRCEVLSRGGACSRDSTAGGMAKEERGEIDRGLRSLV